MGIFSSVMESGVSSFDVEAHEGMDPSMAGLQSAILESAEASFQLMGGMLISDVIMESQIVTESASPEVVMEGFAGGVLDKLKALWQKLWSKVKGWFNAVIRRIQLIFASGEKLVNQFGDEIKKKSALGFKYTGYKYDVTAGDAAADALIAGLEVGYNDTFKLGTNILNGGDADQIQNSYENFAAKTDGKDASALVETIVKSKGGAESLSESHENIIKKYRSDADSTDEIENFTANSVESMLKVVKEGKTTVAKIKRAAADMNDKFAKVISKIEEASKKAVSAASKVDDKDDSDTRASKTEVGTKMTAYFTKAVNALKEIVTAMTSTYGVKVKMNEEAAKTFQAILKKFVTWKPKKAAKESSNEDDDMDEEDMDEDGVLESAMGWL